MYYVFDVDGTICFNGTKIERDIVEELVKLERRGNKVILHLLGQLGICCQL